ncbi:nuclear transport factor 2 family protein [Haliea sp.]
MTETINPANNWALVEKRLGEESDPVLIRNLETVLKHMKAEAMLDLDGLLATVHPDARYHFFGSEDDEAFAGPKGKENVEEFYRSIIAMDIHRIEHDIDRLVVDQHCVITEGEMKIAYPGKLLGEMGYPVDDPEAYYLYQTRSLIVWPMSDDGRVLGEDSYTGKDGFAGIETRKLAPDAIATVKAG